MRVCRDSTDSEFSVANEESALNSAGDLWSAGNIEFPDTRASAVLAPRTRQCAYNRLSPAARVSIKKEKTLRASLVMFYCM